MKLFFFLLQLVAIGVLIVFALRGQLAQGFIWGGAISALGVGPLHTRQSHTAHHLPARTEVREVKAAEVKPARKSA